MYYTRLRYQHVVRGVLCILIFSVSLVAQDRKKLNTRIISSLPSPGPSPQGLAWDGANLWVVDDSTRMVYKVDPSNGSIVNSFAYPGSVPKSIAWDGKYLITLDHQTNNLFRIENTNQVLGTVLSINKLPVKSGNQKSNDSYWGIVCDGGFIYLCIEAGWSSRIVRMDLNDNSESDISYIRGIPKDLAFDGTYVWTCFDRNGPLGIADQYDPINKQRLNKFYTPGSYPTGIAYDGECFWITDREIKKLFRIEVF